MATALFLPLTKLFSAVQALAAWFAPRPAPACSRAGLPAQRDRAHWPAMKERMDAIFRTRTRDEWCARLEGTDVCFAPVLSMEEAADHPHNRARDAFIEVGGMRQPAPAPRFGGTSLAAPQPPGAVAAKTVLADWGLDAGEIERLRL